MSSSSITDAFSRPVRRGLRRGCASDQSKFSSRCPLIPPPCTTAYHLSFQSRVENKYKWATEVSVREAQKKYTNAIAKMKSTKDPVFITFKREYKPQGTTDPLRGDHPFSYVGYIVEYEKNGISYVQVIVTARGTPKNNIKYIL
ncbi:uncharacterized protein LOC119336038 isoform X2 [Triticum dicoccoides]|uniref:uncharacterized protein LOC119336038 isoform X2 n=1 Tax=Triticum dicoccoides TaxID=85692 RepID=UPI001891C5F1|nr:uncharacterized protein LOC119336038 isoform X2 [Triticum dicoccoides]XP_044436490.1 uncharacterized protein LOC123162788 isoform X3 [Triticum aestivum]